jgi:hypothetical protein
MIVKQQTDKPQSASEVSTIEKLIQIDSSNPNRGIQVIVKHIHEYQGSGLMKAFLALLTALLFIFGSVFLAIAASNFSQGIQRSRPVQRF